MASGLRVELRGPHGEIAAAAVRDALACSLDLLQDAASALGTPPGTWTLQEMALGSATLVLANERGDGAVTTVAAGIEALRERPAVPHLWTAGMVRRVRALGRLAGSAGVGSVELGVDGKPLSRVDGVVTDHAEAAVEAREVSLGRVTGVVDVWRERRRREVGMTLDDESTIVATFPAELSPRIRSEAIGARIEAWGELERNAAGQRLRLAIQDFSVVASSVPSPVESIFGLYAELGASGVTVSDVLEDRE